jgi:hypothetical protein
MKVPEKHRIKTGRLASPREFGCNGAFEFKHKGVHFRAIVSDQMGWDHVSVSIGNAERTPTWDEMCFIKQLFWDDEETVIQYHPKKSEYVNNHPYVLHLWKPHVVFPVPPAIFV